MKCMRCGSDIPDNAKDCPCCGYKLDGSDDELDLSKFYKNGNDNKKKSEPVKQESKPSDTDKQNTSKEEYKPSSSQKQTSTSYTDQKNNNNYQYHYTGSLNSNTDTNTGTSTKSSKSDREKKPKKGPKVILLIICFIVIAGAAFYFGHLYGDDAMKLIPGAYQWTEVDGQIYYMNNQGDKKTGWIKADGNTYYCDESGVMLRDWQVIEDCWYYFDSEGKMYTGLQEINGNHYYFGKDGVMQTGWVSIDSSKYYFTENGSMSVGWQYIDGSTYYFNSEGTMTTGWADIEGYTYYFELTGEQLSGCTVLIDSDICTFNENGVLTDRYTVETVADVANTSASVESTEIIETSAETVETSNTEVTEYPVYYVEWEELSISVQRTGDITAKLTITCNGSSNQYKFGPWVTSSSAVKVTTVEGAESYAYISTDDFYFTYGSQFFVVGQTYEFNLTFDMGANSTWSNVELCLAEFGGYPEGYAVDIPM